ncbi:plasma membrane zinc ion transporter [Pyrenophora seminiperda CCB06]|uniref:Plasma membrane zinc ion transporter n=1 Tax=Pyrenophora seminiperda CCB06 TaxID=1302712 RepID=A0A3M7M4G4_9PLEO|nr:plasma membrane zinc ion transporter [Pyrenophora seminiperda CCB06]
MNNSVVLALGDLVSLGNKAAEQPLALDSAQAAMNCPSKTDDDVLWHPEWNQNPPRFAADLTTCADLNGIANARELGEADRLRSTRNLRRCELDDFNGLDTEKKKSVAMSEGVKGSSKGPCTRTSAHVREHQAGLTANATSWAKWLFSVFCTSIVISFANGKLSAPKDVVARDPLYQRLPKRSTCENGKVQPDYNLGLHIGGLFLILFVSSTGCAFPMLVLRFPRLRIPPSFLFGAKHFGTGVLVATAFVHLLPTAFVSLHDPCLSSFWNTDYQAMPGAIMMASVFFVALIEMIFSPAQHVCSGNEGVTAVSRRAEEEPKKEISPPAEAHAALERQYSDSSLRVRDLGALRGRVGSISRTLSRYHENGQNASAIHLPDEPPSKQEASDASMKHGHESGEHAHMLTHDQIHRKAIMQVFLLEMGILFHSIFIGMSLAVSVGSDFTVLLIAIVFHQTFEGLALGVRIADINWKPRAAQPWLMALAYGCTTPIGMAIGIATHTLYSPASEIGLLLVGIMNAISAGFLVYASLVELLSEDFLSDESWKILRGRRRVGACLFVFGGAFLMSLVGAWA